MKSKAIAFGGIGGLIGAILGGLIFVGFKKFDFLVVTAQIPEGVVYTLVGLIIGAGVGNRLWLLRYPVTQRPESDDPWQDFLAG